MFINQSTIWDKEYKQRDSPSSESLSSSITCEYYGAHVGLKQPIDGLVFSAGEGNRKILVLCNLMPPLEVGTPQVKSIKKRNSTVYIWDDFISFIQRVNVDRDKTFILQGSNVFSVFFVPFACCVLNRENQSFLPWILSFSCPEFE